MAQAKFMNLDNSAEGCRTIRVCWYMVDLYIMGLVIKAENNRWDGQSHGNALLIAIFSSYFVYVICRFIDDIFSL